MMRNTVIYRYSKLHVHEFLGEAADWSAASPVVTS